MTEGVIKSQGTRIYFTSSAGSPQQIHKVACPTEVSGFGGGTVAQIPKTCLDSERMEYEAGIEDPTAINLPINVIPRSASHQALIALKKSREVVDWMVVGSDQADAPDTINGDGELVSPGPTSYRTKGYLADFTVQAGTNDLWRGSVTIQPTGADDWDLPAADLD